MMIITVSKDIEDLGESSAILYLVQFDLEGKPLVKIGVTSRTIEERISEILISIFKQYREFPYCRPKRFRKTSDAYEKEAGLLNYFKEYKYATKKKFSGSSEFIDAPLDEVVKVYEDLLLGVITVESLMG